MDNEHDVRFKLLSNKEKVLQVGLRISIKRTDGRIHSAFVTKINHSEMYVNVEWYENDEVKGKEIDFESIEAYNPEVILNNKEKSSRISCGVSKSSRNYRRSEIATAHQSFPNARDANKDGAKISEITMGPIYTTNVDNNYSGKVTKRLEKPKRNQKQADEKNVMQLVGTVNHELARMIAEYRQGLIIKPLKDHVNVEEHLITVCVRKRPLNKSERTRNEIDVITIPSTNQLIVHEPKNRIDLTKYMENQMFRFDYAFDEKCSNEFVYKYTAQPLVKTIFQGGYATCFAYGQTGSGKTHTMGGNFIGNNQDCHHSIYAMATKDVFRFANSVDKYIRLKLSVYASFFEIYSGKVFDLLTSKTKLRVLEDGKQQVQIVGLTETPVKSTDDVLKLIHKGNLARTFGQTAVNACSSRSHAVFQIILRSNLNKHKLHGKLSLIDLAGNERGADTASTDRQTRMEGAEINKSLLALKECIRALGRKKSHLPFRMSKLTQVLKDSFVGSNSRTCMIAMISPGVSSCEHTLNTLRYANRVKELVAGEVTINKEDEIIENENNNENLMKHVDDPEVSLEMMNFHHIVSELQLAEEKMIELQKNVANEMEMATEKAKSLLKMADIVDFNQEMYCTAWENLLTKTITTLTKTKTIVFDFKEKMAEEEKLSRKTLSK